MFSISVGINVTMLISAACYFLSIPTSLALLGLGHTPAARSGSINSAHMSPASEYAPGFER